METKSDIKFAIPVANSQETKNVNAVRISGNEKAESSKAFEKGPSWAALSAKALLMMVVTAAVVFAAAGRIDYWQGWGFVVANLLTAVASLIALRDNPNLINERQSPGEGIKAWDKAILVFSLVVYLASLVVAGLDAGRFGWTGPLPVLMPAIGIFVYMLGQAIFLWAKRTNNFFSSVVRIQKDRGHAVCKDGPYRFMRHPGYVGAFIYSAATPIMLGSLWALVPMGLSAVGLFVRTYLEDAALKEELTGYADYAKEVRFRLVPGVW